MKKIKVLFCGMLVSACLAGNIFAADLNGYGVFTFFDITVNAVVSYLSSTDPCEGRICTNCKPNSEVSGDGGNCRPTEP